MGVYTLGAIALTTVGACFKDEDDFKSDKIQNVGQFN
jgi:hypothetical protein